MDKKRLYTFLIISLVTASVLIYLTKEGYHVVVCPSRLVLGVNCPACGSTRALTALLEGSFRKAFYINPISYILITGGVTAIASMLIDLFFRRDYTWQLYVKINSLTQRKPLFIFLLVIILTIWLFNHNHSTGLTHSFPS